MLLLIAVIVTTGYTIGHKIAVYAGGVIMTNEYIKRAEQFLADTGTTFKIEYLRTGPYFHGDKGIRDIYRFTLINAREVR